MENKRKELFHLSIGMFALIIFTILGAAQGLMDIAHLDPTGLNPSVLPILKGIVIAFAAISIIVLTILAIKGIKESKAPTSARFHIRLAFIACAVFTLSTIAQIPGLFSSTDLFNDIGPVLISSLFIIDTISYAMAAKAIRVKG